MALNRVNTIFYDVFLLKVSGRHSDLRFSFKLKVPLAVMRIVSAPGKRHLNVLVYDLQIVICPGSLTGKPDSPCAFGDKEKIHLII